MPVSIFFFSLTSNECQVVLVYSFIQKFKYCARHWGYSNEQNSPCYLLRQNSPNNLSFWWGNIYKQI